MEATYTSPRRRSGTKKCKRPGCETGNAAEYRDMTQDDFSKKYLCSACGAQAQRHGFPVAAGKMWTLAVKRNNNNLLAAKADVLERLRLCRDSAAAAAAATPAATAAAAGKGKKRGRQDGPPISLAVLGTSPRIVATLDEDWLEQQLPTVELLSDSSWTTKSESQLDLTTHTPREDIAGRIGKELCEDYDEMSQVLRRVGKILRVNETACIGANRAGSHTRKHQHAPMGGVELARRSWWRQQTLALVASR